MKIDQINKKSIIKINDRELLNMHRRTHQLYIGSKKSDFKGNLIEKHNILVNEMKRRGMRHKSPIESTKYMRMVESLIKNYLSYLGEI